MKTIQQTLIDHTKQQMEQANVTYEKAQIKSNMLAVVLSLEADGHITGEQRVEFWEAVKDLSTRITKRR